MGTHEPSQALLRALSGVKIVEQARVAECCGFGGMFSARHPAISSAMVNDKLNSIRDCGADVLVSADCGCLLNQHHAAEMRRVACIWPASCANAWAPPTWPNHSRIDAAEPLEMDMLAF